MTVGELLRLRRFSPRQRRALVALRNQVQKGARSEGAARHHVRVLACTPEGQWLQVAPGLLLGIPLLLYTLEVT